jgi:hypothetical protein
MINTSRVNRTDTTTIELDNIPNPGHARFDASQTQPQLSLIVYQAPSTPKGMTILPGHAQEDDHIILFKHAKGNEHPP